MAGLTIKRRRGEGFLLRFGGVTVRVNVAELSRRRAALNIEAPADVHIIRTELEEEPPREEAAVV